MQQSVHDCDAGLPTLYFAGSRSNNFLRGKIDIAFSSQKLFLKWLMGLTHPTLTSGGCTVLRPKCRRKRPEPTVRCWAWSPPCTRCRLRSCICRWGKRRLRRLPICLVGNFLLAKQFTCVQVKKTHFQAKVFLRRPSWNLAGWVRRKMRKFAGADFCSTTDIWAAGRQPSGCSRP